MNKNAPYSILAAAVLIGWLSDLLFHDSLMTLVPAGLSVPVWNLVFTGFVLLLSRQLKQREKLPKGLWLLAPSILFSFGFAFRDSSTLKWLDMLAVAMCLSLASGSLQGVKVVLSGLTAYIASLCILLFNAVTAGTFLVLEDFKEVQVVPDKYQKAGFAIVRGLAMAVPLVFIFLPLLMSADAKFESMIMRVFHLNFTNLSQHLTVIGISTWLASGFLRSTFSRPVLPLEPFCHLKQFSWKLGVVESTTALAVLNTLFLTFTVLQIPYFFGKASAIACAEYARRGFFELTTVVALILPMLLALDFIVLRETKLQQIAFRGLVAVQIALMAVITVSAMHKMNLYHHAYGLTELRVYTTAFMGWLATVLAIFCGTVLRGKRQSFAFVSFLSGLVFIAGLHIADPDALIVRTNIQRAEEGKSFDAMYALSLSNDAVVPLLKNLDKLQPDDQRVIAEALLSGYARSWKVDWRAWNWSRCTAAQAVHRKLAQLKNAVQIAKIHPEMSTAMASR